MKRRAKKIDHVQQIQLVYRVHQALAVTPEQVITKTAQHGCPASEWVSSSCYKTEPFIDMRL